MSLPNSTSKTVVFSNSQAKSKKVFKQRNIFLVTETNLPDNTLLMPLVRHLFCALLEQQTEDSL